MAVEYRDYYAILGVDRKADDKAIKSAYRKLARQYHPDVAKAKDAGERFKEISEAYEVLSDPEKRHRYDTLGPDWQREAQPGAGARPGGFRVEYGDAGDFSEFFRTIFGDLGGSRAGGRAGRGARARGGFEDVRGGFFDGDIFEHGGGRSGRGQDVQAGVEIALDEAFTGTRRKLTLELEEPCGQCRGAGHVDGKPCAACGGGGWQRAQHEVDVKIPAGVKSGQKVRVAGEGATGAGGRGDLYLVVSVAPHPTFEDRKSTRLNSSHIQKSRMPSSA